MTSYELMIKTNHDLIKDRRLSNSQINTVVKQFLSDKNTAEHTSDIERNIFGNPNKNKKMYPLFYIPPYNDGKKLKTILGQTPKTQILSANMYELEILRLLSIFAPDNPEVADMIAKTLDRLKTTCFGYMDDGVGECFDTSLIVLRFLTAAAPDETEWIKSRIDNFNRHYKDKKRPWFSLWYYWLCLSELSYDLSYCGKSYDNLVYSEIEKYKDELLNWLTNKSLVMNSENDKRIHPVIFCILRNILSNYPEYAYIKIRQPYINDKDGRLYFNMHI